MYSVNDDYEDSYSETRCFGTVDASEIAFEPEKGKILSLPSLYHLPQIFQL